MLIFTLMFTNPKINFSKKFQELPNCLEVDETFKILGIIRNTPKTLVKFQNFVGTLKTTTTY